MMWTPQNTKHAKHGFTLLEMLVVLAIIALTLTLALPQFARSDRPLETKQLALQLAAYARAAQTEAIRSGRTTTMIVDLTTKHMWVEKVRPMIDIPPTISVSMTTARADVPLTNRGDITFFPDGSATGARIVLSSTGQHYEVIVDWLTGATRLEAIQP